MLSKQETLTLRALHPGTEVEMQLNTTTGSKRVKTQLIGIETSKCMIFQIPNEARWGPIKQFLVQDAPLIIRCILEGDGGDVVAFRTNVLRVLGKPSEMFFCSIPDVIQSMGLRTEVRRNPGISVLVSASDVDEKMEFHGIIIDISKGGCRLAVSLEQTFRLMDVGEACVILVEGHRSSEQIVGKVRNVKSDKRYVYYGIQFDENQSSIDRVLYRHTLVD